ncbi:hypothetical protein AC579_4390 [Pseudocercospora musae]|uniref:Uncharacterized protein n=1 Tax=Pseudocercospora musae TaxID=113226 RepID=A0A139IJS2_9PEZI|nr:hypothetical protein AC579_4390 [Pseudocercospora musae]
MLPIGFFGPAPVVVVGCRKRLRDFEQAQRGRAVGQVEGYAAAMRDIGRGRSRSRGRGLPRITYSSPTRTRERSSGRHRSQRYIEDSKSKTSDSKAAVTQDAYEKYKQYKAKHEEYRDRLQAKPEGYNKAYSGYEKDKKKPASSTYDRASRYRELEEELRNKDAEVKKYRIEKDEWRREQAIQRQREEEWRRQQKLGGRAGGNFDPSRVAPRDEADMQYRERYINDGSYDDRQPSFTPNYGGGEQRGRVRFQGYERQDRGGY